MITDNIIHLTGEPGDVLLPDLSLTERVIIMSTYEELQIILSTAILIVAILTYTHKKQPSCTPEKSRIAILIV